MRVYAWFPIGFLAALASISLLCCPLTIYGNQDAPIPNQDTAPIIIPSDTPTAYAIPLEAPQLTATAIIYMATGTAAAYQQNSFSTLTTDQMTATIYVYIVTATPASQTDATLTFNQMTATTIFAGATGTAQALQFGTPTPTDTARG